MNTNGTLPAAVVVTGSSLTAGKGGDGGKGGSPGSGGAGGEGGEGRPEQIVDYCAIGGPAGGGDLFTPFFSGAGGDAGDGGEGQPGSGGGGGAGGVSYAIYYGNNVPKPNVTTTSLTASAGGKGGLQHGTSLSAVTGASAQSNKPVGP